MSLTIASGYGIPASNTSRATPLEQYESTYGAGTQDDADFSGIAQSLLSSANISEAAGQNIASGEAMLATAEGGASNVTSQLGTMAELAMQAGDGAMNSNDLGAVSAAYSAAAGGVAQTINATTFNGQQLLGGQATPLPIQIGGGKADAMNASVGGMSLATMGLPSSTGSGGAALTWIQAALQRVDGSQSKFGAMSEGLETEGAVTSVASTNLETSLGPYDGGNLAQGLSQLSQGEVQQQAKTLVEGMENQSSSLALNLIA